MISTPANRKRNWLLANLALEGQPEEWFDFAPQEIEEELERIENPHLRPFDELPSERELDSLLKNYQTLATQH